MTVCDPIADIKKRAQEENKKRGFISDNYYDEYISAVMNLYGLSRQDAIQRIEDECKDRLNVRVD